MFYNLTAMNYVTKAYRGISAVARRLRFRTP